MYELIYIFKSNFLSFLFFLLCTTTIVNGVYSGNRSSSMYWWRINGWFNKGTNTQSYWAPPPRRALTSVVWRYFLFGGLGGLRLALLFVPRQTDWPLPPPPPLGGSLKPNERVRAARLKTATAPSSCLTCDVSFRIHPSDGGSRRGRRRDGFESGHRANEKLGKWNGNFLLLFLFSFFLKLKCCWDHI